MKKLTVSIFTLIFILTLSGCGKHTQGGRDTVRDSAKVDTQEDSCIADTNPGGREGDYVITDIFPPNLNLPTLRDLVDRYGENLTWSDLEPYYREDVSSGLYILRYPIDWNYSLLIGGTSVEQPPLYILLVSEHDTENTIDVRFESVDDFISSTPQIAEFSYAEVLETYHENDPGVKNSEFHNTSMVAIETLSDVLRLAKNECTVEYDTADISYDSTACVWQVAFYKSGTVGGDQTVYMDCNGATCLVVYGE